MPARSIATFTASATFSTIATRPMSSGCSTSLIAKPTVSRGSSLGSASVVAKMVAWGLSTPSVPPDQTMGICFTCSAGAPFSSSTSRKARSEMIRV